mmetsp:Transcript_26440/g.70692  ORF Transcript_26440/g.70692 Transcript_26440/m.70692 type:complete len:371 (-) Transcript_26440:94-1206(-)
MIHGMQYGGFLARADLRAYEHAPRSITHTVFGGTCNSVAFTQAFGGGRRELLRLEQEGMLPDPNSLPSLFVGTEQMLLDEGICNVNRDGKGWPAVATAPGELIHLMGPAYLTDFKPIWRRNYHAWMEYAAKSGARVLIWNDRTLAKLVQEKEPSFYRDVYVRYERNIFRWDAARAVVLRHFGGIYFDLDVEVCDYSFLGELSTVGPSIVENEVGRETRVQNTIMASPANSTPARLLWDNYLTVLRERANFSEYGQLQVQDRTGPGALSAALSLTERKASAAVEDNSDSGGVGRGGAATGGGGRSITHDLLPAARFNPPSAVSECSEGSPFSTIHQGTCSWCVRVAGLGEFTERRLSLVDKDEEEVMALGY